jgi:hypothetical protein
MIRFATMGSRFFVWVSTLPRHEYPLVEDFSECYITHSLRCDPEVKRLARDRDVIEGLVPKSSTKA